MDSGSPLRQPKREGGKGGMQTNRDLKNNHDVSCSNPRGITIGDFFPIYPSLGRELPGYERVACILGINQVRTSWPVRHGYRKKENKYLSELIEQKL